MEVQLSETAAARLRRPVSGQGGFQRLLRKLQARLSGSVVTVDAADVEKLRRYSHAYGRGGFQTRTRPSAADAQLRLGFG